MSSEIIKTALTFAPQAGGLVVVMAEGTTVVAATSVALAIAGTLLLVGGCVYLAFDSAQKNIKQ